MNIKRDLISANYTQGRNGQKVKEITIHHTAGKILLPNLWALFNNTEAKVSSHYGIRDNDVLQFVDENSTAWTNSNWSANIRAITIEVCNSSNGPEWEVSPESYQTLIDLVYDIAYRHKLLPLVRGINLTYHSMYDLTACPGPFLFNRIDNIITQVNALYNVASGDYSPKPTETNIYRVRETWEDVSSQKGAYGFLENAIKHCDQLNNNPRYAVYDNDGKMIYPV